jgi:SAM-dependent methyltransferase
METLRKAEKTKGVKQRPYTVKEPPAYDIRQIAVCEAKGIKVKKSACILDYGCGAGGRVYQLLDAGYSSAIGCDVIDYLKLRSPEDRKRFHIDPSGKIPLPDASVDFVFSDQVFEHVLNQPQAFREIYRVLKPGGVSVHVIPSKWQLIEPHIKVPLGGLNPFKRRGWYTIWAYAGIRNEYQKGLPAQEVVRRNYDYAHKGLCYWSSRQYRQLFKEIGWSEWSWEDLTYMQESFKPRILQLARVSERLPIILILIRTFWHRVLLTRKSES